MLEAILSSLLALNPVTLKGERAVTLAQAIHSSAAESVCAGDWQGADWCRRTWPGTELEAAAVLIAQGTRESNFMERIHAGRCKPWECDAGLAISPWQLHRSRWFPEPIWRGFAGVEYVPTADAAGAALRVLGAGYRDCGSLEGAFARFARGTGCRWEGAARRVRLVRVVEERLARTR